MDSRLALSVTPAGHLALVPSQGDDGAIDAAPAKRMVKAFEAGSGHGLLHLGAVEVGALLPPPFAFFRELGRLFVIELLARPDLEDRRGEVRLEAPLERFEALLQQTPPMRGGEYLSLDVLDALWEALHQAFAAELAGNDRSVQEFFAARSPAWSGVGRIHFHLAENRGDPERPFAFLATFTTGLAPHGKAKHRSLGVAVRESSSSGDKDRLVALLLPLQRAAAASPLIQELVESRAIFEPLAWTVREAHRFLQEIPALEKSGVIVRMPDGWKARRPARPRVTIEVGKEPPAGVGLEALLTFSARATLEGDALDEEDLRILRESTEGLVFLKGRWVEVDRERLGEVLSRWEQARRQAEEGIPLAEAMRLLAGLPDETSSEVDPQREWTGFVPGEWLSQTLQALRGDGAEAAPPESFQATLRPYQRQGLAWLRFLTRLRLGACLADDMGLGKTVQVLALLSWMREHGGVHGPHLLVCPASLIANWRAEAERFAPGLKVFVAHSSEVEAKALAAMDPSAVDGMDLVITSYGSTPRLGWLSAREWGLVILDEAQAIKNPAIRQTKAVKALRSTARIALTGTPVENRVGDLWSLFDFLNPGLLGSAKEFTRFVKETESFGPLRSLVRPYILRRLKTDPKVIQDLPAKTEVPAFCGLTRRQVALYQDTVNGLKKRLAETEGIERRGLVLATLLRLKQICNHPSHWLADGSWAPGDSGKFERLRELCEEIAARQEKVLVFSQFREVTKPLAQYLTSVFGRPGLVLSGETAVRQRQQLVRAFQEDEQVPFFVLSLKAGGTGLNLTAASHVIHFDRWWNPAVENQATDRAFRIGQRKNVLVHKFICRGTVEERIDEMITAKLGMARELLEGDSEVKLTELSDAELMNVVRLDVRSARGEG